MNICRVCPLKWIRNVDPRCTPQEISWIFLLFNPSNPELNPICHLLALLGVHLFLHVSRIRVKYHNDYITKCLEERKWLTPAKILKFYWNCRQRGRKRVERTNGYWTIIDVWWFQWPRGLRRGFAAVRLLELWERMSASCQCCVVLCAVVSGTGICDGLFTRSKESYRVRCVWVWSWKVGN
jgi:hypothetical protein